MTSVGLSDLCPPLNLYACQDSGAPVEKSTSLMYSWLQTARQEEPHRAQAQFEKAFQTSFSNEQWK